MPTPPTTLILQAADDCLHHSPTGTIGLRDIYYTLATRRKNYREPQQDTPTLMQISRTLLTHGYQITEPRPKSYSRYKKIDPHPPQNQDT